MAGQMRVVNLSGFTLNKNEVEFRVDRRTALGNPYLLVNDIWQQRSYIIGLYRKEYLDIIMNDTITDDEYVRYMSSRWEASAKELVCVRRAVKRAINKIRLLLLTKDVALACHCAPKACHATEIIKFIREAEKNESTRTKTTATSNA